MKKKKVEHWFSPRGIIKNFKTIHFLQMKKAKDGTDGVLSIFFKTVLIMLGFGLLFTLFDGLLSMGMSAVGLL